MSALSAVSIVATLALAGAPAAIADSGDSSNWAGYAIHRSGVRFTTVSAAWKQPSAKCKQGHRTYSAVWVGLGGFAASSNALEQVGTELDCTASGKAVSSVWYELVPAASRPVRMKVRPGDRIVAGVTVVGDHVHVAIFDLTRGTGFQKTLRARSIDVSSAEWILEAPSACTSDTSCQTLPLANFRKTTFLQAQAQSTDGHRGTIADSSWSRTKIRLVPGGRRFVSYHGSGTAGGGATTSGLKAGGGSFTVSFARWSLRASPFLAADRPSPSSYVVHPGR